MILPKLGKPLQETFGGGIALIPSNARVASVGTPINLPLRHKDEARFLATSTFNPDVS